MVIKSEENLFDKTNAGGNISFLKYPYSNIKQGNQNYSIFNRSNQRKVPGARLRSGSETIQPV